MNRAEIGKFCWIDIGEPELWVLGKVLAVNHQQSNSNNNNSNNNTSIKVEIIGHSFDDFANEARGTIVETTKYLSFDSQQLSDWHDAMRMAGELNEASLLHLLQRRFQQSSPGEMIYTFLGDVLISINPYKDVGALSVAHMPTLDQFEERELLGTTVPHLHVVSERAHKLMLTHGPKGTSQSILINGESGSGKTEAAKCLMKCLAQRSFIKRQILKKQATKELNNNLKRMGLHGKSTLEKRGLALLSAKGKQRGGATVAANKLMETSRPEMDGTEDVEDVGSKVERSFIVANPLLEAFGNAQTKNNHNSSRFGKFVRIEYDDDGCIVGTSTRCFFLEKTRVVNRAYRECNFHSFYLLLNAYRQKHEMINERDFPELAPFADAEFTPKLLRKTERAHGGHNRRRTTAADDSEEDDDDNAQGDAAAAAAALLAQFEATNKSMQAIGLSPQEQQSVWKMLSVVLTFGNLEFSELKLDNLARSKVTSGLDQCAALLGLPPAQLERGLCQRSIRAGRSNQRESVSCSPMSLERARTSTEGLVKAMYHALFTWLVEQVNESSKETTAHVEKSRRKDPLFVGVLDIFGFEVLTTNSFEQLCINFANEVLQRFFDVHVVELEHRIYREQGVDSSSFTFRDNSPIIHLLSGKPMGIFRILDESCMIMGDGNNGATTALDQAFLAKLDQAHKSDTLVYRARPVLHVDGQFEVKHFAGAVVYDVALFLQKNKDVLEPDLADMLAALASNTTNSDDDDDSSQSRFAPFVGRVFVAANASLAAAEDADFKPEVSTRKLANLETVSGRFRTDMNDLTALLSQTDQHFVRCLVPNKHKQKDTWVPSVVLDQLRYLSVMEMVRIRTEGFPVRIDFPDLMGKFTDLIPADPPPGMLTWYPGVNDRKASEALLRYHLGPESEKTLWVAGTTKMFLRDGVVSALMQRVTSKKNSAAIKIQKLTRGYLCRQDLQRKQDAAQRIQRWYRARLAHRPSRGDVEAEKQAKAALVLQCFVRQQQARAARVRRMKAVLDIQRFYRALKRRRVQRRMQAITLIQAWFRKTRCQQSFWRFRMSVVTLQARIRARYVRKRYFLVKETRRQWSSVLKPNEAIVLTSMVQKTSDVHGVRTLGKTLGGMFASKKYRQLIFTTGPGAGEFQAKTSPRLMYVDPANKQVKGEIPYDTSLTSSLSVGDKDFLVFSKPTDDKQDKTPIWNFTDELGPAVCWVRSIRRNVSVLELVRDAQPVEFHTKQTSSCRGPLLMRQLQGPKKYTELFFTLVGADLWWIHAPGQVTPSGGVNLTQHCTVRVIDTPRDLPGVPEYAFWLQTPCRTKPLKFRSHDAEVVQNWVNCIERVIRKCRDEDQSKQNAVAFAERIYNAGCALFDAKNFSGARFKFKDAIDLLRSPAAAAAASKQSYDAKQIMLDSLERRAKCGVMLGMYELALQDAKDGLALKPAHEQCWRVKAACLERMKQYDASLVEYELLVERFPAPDIKVHRDRVAKTMEVMMTLKQRNQAKKQAQQAKAEAATAPPKKPVVVKQQLVLSKTATTTTTATATAKTAATAPAVAVKPVAPVAVAAPPPPPEVQAPKPPPPSGVTSSSSGKRKKSQPSNLVVRAIADYVPAEENAADDLAFQRGDEITVLLQYKDGWWKGELRGRTGLFPSTFVDTSAVQRNSSSTRQ